MAKAAHINLFKPPPSSNLYGDCRLSQIFPQQKQMSLSTEFQNDLRETESSSGKTSVTVSFPSPVLNASRHGASSQENRNSSQNMITETIYSKRSLVDYEKPLPSRRPPSDSRLKLGEFKFSQKLHLPASSATVSLSSDETESHVSQIFKNPNMGFCAGVPLPPSHVDDIQLSQMFENQTAASLSVPLPPYESDVQLFERFQKPVTAAVPMHLSEESSGQTLLKYSQQNSTQTTSSGMYPTGRKDVKSFPQLFKHDKSHDAPAGTRDDRLFDHNSLQTTQALQTTQDLLLQSKIATSLKSMPLNSCEMYKFDSQSSTSSYSETRQLHPRPSNTASCTKRVSPGMLKYCTRKFESSSQSELPYSKRNCLNTESLPISPTKNQMAELSGSSYGLPSNFDKELDEISNMLEDEDQYRCSTYLSSAKAPTSSGGYRNMSFQNRLNPKVTNALLTNQHISSDDTLSQQTATNVPMR